jgi:magnesium chelatase family protein
MQIQRYIGRISGPLLDRIDIHIDVPAVKFRELRGEALPETDSSATIRQRVIKARAQQHRRLASEKIFSNGAMTPRMIRAYCQIDSHSEKLLENAMRRLGLSARAYDRILKVSRTIADLAGSEAIGPNHVSEAVGYRSFDRTYWT